MTAEEIPAASAARAEPPRPRRDGLVAAFDEVLKHPERALGRLTSPGAGGAALRLCAGSLVAVALYGGVAGWFGDQALLAAWKAPLVVALAVTLCAPSLYVLAALAGRDLEPRAFAGALAGFLATLGLVLVALLPIAWLFSVSSRSLVFVVWLHAILWTFAVLLATRFLGRLLADHGGTLFLWTVLLLLVSLQAATVLRPLLAREAGEPVFAERRLFFFEHLRAIARAEEAAAAADKAAPRN